MWKHPFPLKGKMSRIGYHMFGLQKKKKRTTGQICAPIKMKTKGDTPEHEQHKQLILVEGDPKAPFSIATTPRCRGERHSFPSIAPLYPWYVPYNLSVMQGGIKYHFLSLWYGSTWDWTPVSRTIGEYSVANQANIRRRNATTE